jgi:hypothetical protein
VRPAAGHAGDGTPSDTLEGIWVSTLSDTQAIKLIEREASWSM